LGGAIRSDVSEPCLLVDGYGTADHELTLLSDGADRTKLLFGGAYFRRLDHVAPGALTGDDWITR